MAQRLQLLDKHIEPA